MKKLLWAGSVLVAIAAWPASAADLPPRVYEAPPPAVFNWTGCYLGLQIGGQWGGWTAGVDYPAPATTGTRELHSSGTFIGGAQIGCNYQPVASMFVIGVEGDIVAARNDFSGEVLRLAAVPTNHFDASGRIGSQGSMRLRLGAAWDRLLVYVAGGATWANIDTTHDLVRDGVGAASFKFSATQVGWNVGIGLDYAFAGGWTAGLEYRYTGYGSHAHLVPTGFVPFVFPTHTARGENVHTSDVRVRLNYLFGGPVVARY